MVLPLIILIAGIVILAMIVIAVIFGIIWVYTHPVETVIILIVLAFLGYLYVSPKARKKLMR